MDTIKSSLRKLIEEHPDSLHKIARKAEVPYFPIYRFMTGRTETLDTDVAEGLVLWLTKKPLKVGKGVAA
jgi:hypothetical protein